MTASGRARRRPSWAANYPPLLVSALLMVLLLAVLPSALNLPQANPSTTLEYAPVPPEDDAADPPPVGNLSSLSLASSGELGAGDAAGPGDGGGGEATAGVGKNPSTKRCVGRPPRQTEDKLSPPCVAHFSGNNGGATYPGVTADEIRILIYHDCCIQNQSSRGVEPDPPDTYYDLGAPEDPDQPSSVAARTLRAFQSYFNERYQTYGRRVHFWLYFAPSYVSTQNRSPESRRRDAIENYKKIQPFAVLTYTTYGHEYAYLETMARRGVMNFGADQSQDESFYRRFPKLVWGYQPSLQILARQYSSYVCTKVVPYPVSFSGNAGHNGRPRRLGMLYLENSQYPEIKKFATLVEERVRACGGNIVLTRPFTESGQAATGTDAETAALNMAAFQSEDVTTILWPQGFETLHSKAAANINYRPEWVVAGDRSHDGNRAASFQEQSVWQHAWVVSNLTLQPETLDTDCAHALREGDPEIHPLDITHTCTLRNFYNELRQLFTGIQVAGPKLGPPTIDRGFHAIPSIASTDPSVPACYYEANDYTCVKDAIAMWWDPSQRSSSNTQGCWRMAEGGQRYLVERWREGDVLTSKQPDTDPCINFGGVFFV